MFQPVLYSNFIQCIILYLTFMEEGSQRDCVLYIATVQLIYQLCAEI
jgi:hypothetical protein